jgi:hypothetical protein
LQVTPTTPPGVPLAVTVAALIAMVGAVSFLMDFGPWNSPQGDGKGAGNGTISAAVVVYRAGALPSALTPRAAF